MCYSKAVKSKIPVLLLLIIIIPLFLAFGKGTGDGDSPLNPEEFRMASDRLFDLEYYSLIKGKTIGFFGNQTSLDTLNRLIDDEQVEVARIFVPEHGLMGAVQAGYEVSDGLYRGIPVVSAYGYGARKIAPEKLEDLDLLLFEIQDIGNRHYTYISSLYLQMDSCADAGIPLILLDRPNTAGDKVEGPIMEASRQSYIGLFGPVAHGMTIGELAEFFRDEPYWMNGDRYPRIKEEDPFYNMSELDLTVVPMAYYNRKKGYYQTAANRARWIPTSPNIPTPESAVCYKGTGLLDGHELKEIVPHYEENGVQQFESILLPGVVTRDEMMSFIQACYDMYDFPGVRLIPRKNRLSHNWDILQFKVEDLEEYHSTLSVMALLYVWESHKHPGEDHGFTNRDMFDKSIGNGWVSHMLISSEAYGFSDIRQLIEIDETLFKEARKPYLLYP